MKWLVEKPLRRVYVGTDKLTFDFNANGLTPSQLADIERLVNERILEDEPLSWTEMPMAEVMKRTISYTSLARSMARLFALFKLAVVATRWMAIPWVCGGGPIPRRQKMVYSNYQRIGGGGWDSSN